MSRRYVARFRIPITLFLVLQIILPLGAVSPPPVAVAAEAVASGDSRAMPQTSLTPEAAPEQRVYLPVVLGAAAPTPGTDSLVNPSGNQPVVAASAELPAGALTPETPGEPATGPGAAAERPLLPFLSLTATAEPESLAPGEESVLRWRVANLGGQTAEGILFTATIPQGLVLTPANVAPHTHQAKAPSAQVVVSGRSNRLATKSKA